MAKVVVVLLVEQARRDTTTSSAMPPGIVDSAKTALRRRRVRNNGGREARKQARFVRRPSGYQLRLYFETTQRRHSCVASQVRSEDCWLLSEREAYTALASQRSGYTMDGAAGHC